MEDKIKEMSQKLGQKDDNWERKENLMISVGSLICESSEIQKE